MVRGAARTEVEQAHLALASIYKSEDMIVGMEQSATRFREAMYMKFKMLAPADATDKTNRCRTSQSVRATFDELAADILPLAHN